MVLLKMFETFALYANLRNAIIAAYVYVTVHSQC